VKSPGLIPNTKKRKKEKKKVLGQNENICFSAHLIPGV
jgi:hypothetical protein